MDRKKRPRTKYVIRRDEKGNMLNWYPCREHNGQKYYMVHQATYTREEPVINNSSAN